MSKYRSSIIIAAILLIAAVLFSTCISNEEEKQAETVAPPPFVPRFSYSDFAGPASCKSCHKDIYETHLQTGHFGTTAVADGGNIAGSFDTSKNKVFFASGGQINMEKLDSGFYQTAYVKGKKRNCERFDIVVGVAAQGQSYMSWDNGKLYQLPITYFTSAKQWSNSPGYPNHIAFNRPIDSRCLECHTTMADKISEQGVVPEIFDPKKMILGVTCERCHGPGAKHVEYQAKNPRDLTAKFIINSKNFSRQQSLDLCAMCHGGLPDAKKPAFEFVAGDRLSDYFSIDTISIDASSIDVHGNQYGMLRASKCFAMSQMTCMTCHDPHQNQKGSVAALSQKCMSCHSGGHKEEVVCKLTAMMGKDIINNCTKCHMPSQPSRAIAVILQGQSIPTPAAMHTHLIKNYPEETEKIIALFKSKK